jgi:ubiquinone/menaquinone biosynthesis C-methylase UbiE
VTELVLPPRELVPTFNVPPDDLLVNLIYNPMSGLVYRQRFRMALRAIPASHAGSELLEVGCGAGVLIPSLARRGGRVEAVDVHAQIEGVRHMLRECQVANAHVQHGSILELPYADGRFSEVVCLSVLEHFKELDRAISELARVTARGGSVVLGFPAKNIVTRALFRMVGYRDDIIHPSGHRDILRAAARHMRLDRQWVFPAVPLDLSLYVVARFRA